VSASASNVSVLAQSAAPTRKDRSTRLAVSIARMLGKEFGQTAHVPPQLPQLKLTKTERRIPKKPFYLYLAKDGFTNLVKIGFARDVKARLKHLELGATSPLGLIKSWECGADALKVERLLHASLAPFRKHREWFDLPEHVLAQLLSCSIQRTL
jgi:Meiotically Up-regulated Gene 113 (MUG113) protein